MPVREPESFPWHSSICPSCVSSAELPGPCLPAAAPLRRLVFAVLIVAIAAAAAFLVYRRVAGAATEVEQATVTLAYPYQAISVLNATGYVVAQRKASVASKATGRLEWLGVRRAAASSKGEVIARLESQDVAATRDQAAANVRVAQANLEQARGGVARGQARARSLRGPAGEELRLAGLARRRRSRATTRRRRRSTAPRPRCGAAQANLRAAEVAVEQTVIRAPFDGVVLTKNANVGDTITPFSSALDTKGAVVTMADMTTLEVEADVSESNLQKVHVDQPCEIELDALPERALRGLASAAWCRRSTAPRRP